MRYITTKAQLTILLHTGKKYLEKFGLRDGDLIESSNQGLGTVLGVCQNNYLWINFHRYERTMNFGDAIFDANSLAKAGIKVIKKNITQLQKQEDFGCDIFKKLVDFVLKEDVEKLEKLLQTFSTFRQIDIDPFCYFTDNNKSLIGIAIEKGCLKSVQVLIQHDTIFYYSDIFDALKLKYYDIAVQLFKIKIKDADNISDIISLKDDNKAQSMAVLNHFLHFIDSIKYSDFTLEEWSRLLNFWWDLSVYMISNLNDKIFINNITNTQGLILIALLERCIQGLNFNLAEGFFKRAEFFWCQSSSKKLPDYSEAFFKLAQAKMALLNAAYEEGNVSFTGESLTKEEEKKLFKNYCITQMLPFLEKSELAGNAKAKELATRLKVDKYDLQTNSGKIDDSVMKAILDNEFEEVFTELADDVLDPNITINPIIASQVNSKTNYSEYSILSFFEQDRTSQEVKGQEPSSKNKKLKIKKTNFLKNMKLNSN